MVDDQVYEGIGQVIGAAFADAALAGLQPLPDDVEVVVVVFLEGNDVVGARR